MNPSLPSRELLRLQAEWLQDARARLLRIAEIARRKTVLDLGSGYGFVTHELRRRTSGTVIGLDRSVQSVSSYPPAVCGIAPDLPFRDASFDLVFSQNVLMWIPQVAQTISAVARILQPAGGVWVLFEPDYGGFIEHPPELQTSMLWNAALKRSGGDPLIGRKLPSMLVKAGFHIRTELLPRLEPPSMERFAFLGELELTADERRQLQQIQQAAANLPSSAQMAHLPYFLIIAERV